MKYRHQAAILITAVAVAGAVGAGSAPGGTPATAAPSGATAAPQVLAAPPAYLNPGKNLAANCFQCHGTNGRNGQFDSLAGEPAAETFKDMKEFQTTTETGDEAIMKVHALGYTDEQLWQIAHFFEAQR